MGTVRDLITDSLFELGAIGVGEIISPEDGAIGLRYLNQLLDNWNAERLNIYSKRSDQIPLAANTASVGIGNAPVTPAIVPGNPTVLTVANNAQVGQSVTFSGAIGAWVGLNASFVISGRTPTTVTIPFDSSALVSPITGVVVAQFNMPRPVVIETANFVNANGESFDLKLLSSQEWSRKPSKATQDRIAIELYCDFAYPVSTLFPWPIGNQDNCKLELWTWAPLQQFTGLTQVLDFPPGYAAAIKFNLAVDLAGAFGRELQNSTISRAGQYKAVIQGINPPPIPGAMTEMLVSQPPAATPPPPAR